MIEERSNSTSNNEKSNSVFVAHVLNNCLQLAFSQYQPYGTQRYFHVV